MSTIVDNYKLPELEVLEDSVSEGIRFEHGISRYSKFKPIFDEFMSFVQRSDPTVQAWSLCGHGDLESFYGATFRIPMKDSTEITSNDIASINAVTGTVTKESVVVEKTSIVSPCFYMSLEYQNVSDNYYSNFVNNDYMTPNDNTAAYANMINKGEFTAICLHTLFDSNLYMSEQGGSTCTKVSDLDQVDIKDEEANFNNTTTVANLLNYTTGSGSAITHVGCVSAPIPGTGCPWFTYSKDNSTVYDTIEFFFTKTNYGGSITLCYYSSTDESVDKVWQSISFGMLEADNTSHKFPLYVAGGSTALVPATYRYYIPHPVGQPTPVNVYGNKYNLDLKPSSLCNSTLLYPSKLKYTGITNFAVKAPDGEWKFAFVYRQKGQVIRLGEYSYVPADIELVNSGNSTIYPTISDTKNDGGIYTSVPSIIGNLHKVRVLAENVDTKEEHGLYGTIPYHFSLRGINKDGLITMGNKRYIVMPNGWNNRIPFYKQLVISGDEDVEGVIKEYYEDLEKYAFTNSLVIEVGDKS